MIVQSFGQLQALTTPSWSSSGSSTNALTLYGLNQAYAEIYRTQPNVRICVDFLARNIAHLTPVVYRRVSRTDRVHLPDHDLTRWLGKPNPSTRRYRLTETLMGDLGVYFEAYWLKVRHLDGRGKRAIGLVGLPPEEMDVPGGLLPTHFEWTTNHRVKEFALSEIVYYNGYNPTNRRRGLSPLETLRNILAEEEAASSSREAFWRSSSRMEGVIERPATAPKWTPEQKRSWRDQWREFSAGGAKAGEVGVLEDGMTYKQASFSAKDSEYTAGGKLRREVVAAAYHIPQPMVGILEHATFSNIREQHKHLYQDTLGPWLEMIQQEIEGQLLTECEDQDNVYVEFNIDAKLAGTPEERAQSLQLSIGKPWRTVNEGRALENLPRDPDPESDRIAPQQGGPSDATANPSRTPPDPAPRRQDDDEDDDEDDEEAEARTVTTVLLATHARQQVWLQKIAAADRALAFLADLERWNTELTADLTPLVGAKPAALLAEQTNQRRLTALLQEAA